MNERNVCKLTDEWKRWPHLTRIRDMKVCGEGGGREGGTQFEVDGWCRAHAGREVNIRALRRSSVGRGVGVAKM